LARKSNTDSKGRPFIKETVAKVWDKGEIITDGMKDMARDDQKGDHIAKINYGEERRYGWEIDHIKPVSRGTTDELDNLRPLHWKNNRRKGNKSERTEPNSHSHR